MPASLTTPPALTLHSPGQYSPGTSPTRASSTRRTARSADERLAARPQLGGEPVVLRLRARLGDLLVLDVDPAQVGRVAGQRQPHQRARTALGRAEERPGDRREHLPDAAL